MNAGMIFSICAGILIGLKLFCNIQKSGKQEKKIKKNRKKDDCRKQYQEALNLFQQKVETDQRKASLEMQVNLLRQKLELEKAKQIIKEQRYIRPLWLVSDSTVTTNNDNIWQPSYFDPQTFEHANEAVQKEKLRRICRDLWYGTCPEAHDKGQDDYFEEILNDPTTVFMEQPDILPFGYRKIIVKSRGKTHEFLASDIEMRKYF